MKNPINNFSKLDLGVFLAILLWGVVLYLTPLQSPTFCFDDNSSIVDNEAVKTINVPKIFNAFNTRSLVGLSFAFNYHWCALHPPGYRWVNLLIHCLNAFLVYLLAQATLCLYPTSKPMAQGHIKAAAFFASILFLCHPIQTEPVNFITQRFVLMGTFFYLLTLVFYIQYRCRFQKRYLLAGIVSAMAAMFCKEFVVTLPLMLALYEFYFLNDETFLKRCRHLMPFFIIILIVPVLLLRTPSAAIGVAAIADSRIIQEGKTVKVGIDITRARSRISRKQYFLTELNVMRTYVRLLFVPVNQNFDYDYPLSTGMDAKTALSAVFLLCLLATAVLTYRSYRIVSFGILWFFIALSVESSFIPIGHVIAEYRLYLASAGFAFLLMGLIYIRQAGPKWLNIAAAVILVGFSVLTCQRNKIWKDELTLWNDTIIKSPHKARPYNNRGAIYTKEGRFAQALTDYNIAIGLDGSYADAYYNRGIVYEKMGDTSRAIADCTRAIAINPNLAQAYYNRGTIYAKHNNIPQAIADFTKAIAIDPDLIQAYYNRGLMYGQQGDFNGALVDFTKAIEIDPAYAEAYNNRGGVLVKERNFPEAIVDFTKAVTINPGFSEAFNNRGGVYYRQGNFAQAILDFTQALAINPALAEAHYNCGLIYGQQGDLVKAVSEYTKTIDIDPDLAEGYYSRGGIYVRQGKIPQAVADWTQAIGLYYSRGIMNDSQGNYSQAVSDFTNVLAINPYLGAAYYDRGSVYIQQGDFVKAVSDLTRAIEIDPGYAPAYHNRDIALSLLKQSKKNVTP